ncbi:cytochrome C [Aquabacterium sp.]|uniref:cytochrome C n=1 Tax=Aquabacterium sp. TaxID=1872578 RepID=UPI003785323B
MPRPRWQAAGRAWRQVIAGLGLLLLMLPALAQNLESVLRPGELIRGHAQWDEACEQCHVRFDRAAQNERCMACHKDVGADVRQRRGHHGRLPAQPCRACHTDHKGRDARIVQLDTQRFDHRQTDFVLRGKHEGAACQKCHPAGRKYSQAPGDCASCHRADDVHKGGLGAQCADCHGETDWRQARFDHGRTRFALTGRHAEARCTDCHRNNVYTEAPRTCIGCHRKDDDGARGHHGRFGERCDSCHGSKAWKPASFNHDADTRFALRGKHRAATCTACHTGVLFKDKTGTACVDCHRKDDRHEGSLGRECQACHSERDWKDTGTRFDHARTRFALLGKHRDVRCDACHANQRYQGTATECVACHRKDDRHRPSLGQACESCHGERDWKDVSRFDHQKTRFALQGRHRDTRCADCHRSSNYREAASDCVACHRPDDKHANTLGSGCGDCHDARAWKPAPAFDHQRTRFALRNAHAAPAVACSACHADARHYRDLARDCIACHRKDDRHAGQSGERCEACHADTRWRDTRFDHAQARFPLLGRHLALACSSCHLSLRYRDAARECDGCHRKDDRHLRKFGSACESCHNARSWRLWRFDHERRGRYKLDGAHARVACEACHTAPAPAGRAIADVGGGCIACHQRDDKHEGAFGVQCDRCHDTANWRQVRQRSGAVHTWPRDLRAGRLA